MTSASGSSLRLVQQGQLLLVLLHHVEERPAVAQQVRGAVGVLGADLEADAAQGAGERAVEAEEVLVGDDGVDPLGLQGRRGRAAPPRREEKVSTVTSLASSYSGSSIPLNLYIMPPWRISASSPKNRAPKNSAVSTAARIPARRPQVRATTRLPRR